MVKKKIISMLVTAAMVIGMFPMIVAAEGEEPEQPGTFSELQEIIDQSESPYISVEKDYIAVSGEGPLTVNPKYSFTSISLKGHIISRNLTEGTATENGQVFKLSTNDNLTLVGPGTVTGGNAINGGAIYVDKDASFSIEGAVNITGNKATNNGGAIYNAGIVDINFSYGDNGGEIAKNKAGGNGGGVYNAGSFSLGRSYIITKNEADGKGSGLYQAAEASDLRIKDSPSIYDNTNDNLYLSEGKTIDVNRRYLVYNNSLANIYVSAEKTPADFTSGYSDITDEPTSFFHPDAGFVVERNTETREAKITKTGELNETPEFAGMSMTLDGRIGVNVYIDPGMVSVDDLASSKMSFTISGKEARTGAKNQEDTFDPLFTKVDSKTGHTLYGYTCYLSSIQMAQKVTAVFTYTEDGVEKTVESDPKKPYVVEDYCVSVLSGSQYSSTEKSIAAAFLDYGYYMQEYLGTQNNLDFTSNDGYKKMSRGAYGLGSESYETTKNKCEPFKADRGTFAGNMFFKLELENTTSIIVYFSAETDSGFKATCSYGGKTFKSYYDTNEGSFAIRISGIHLQNMDNKIEINDADGETLVSVYVLSYAYSVLKNSSASEAQKTAMVALYNLYISAKNYVS